MEIINTKTNHCHEIVVPRHSFSKSYVSDENYGHCHEIKIGKHRFVDIKEEVKK